MFFVRAHWAKTKSLKEYIRYYRIVNLNTAQNVEKEIVIARLKKPILQ